MSYVPIILKPRPCDDCTVKQAMVTISSLGLETYLCVMCADLRRLSSEHRGKRHTGLPGIDDEAIIARVADASEDAFDMAHLPAPRKP